jgi:dimethylaniline monooxygenase (N-oxide forming)
VPQFPGEDEFTGSLLHSAEYKDPEMFAGKDVLIVGTGETAFDLGYQAATGGAKTVTMSTRHGFVSVPAYFGDTLPPLDCLIMNWATHGWESNWAMRVGLHWWITTKFTRIGFWLTTGSSYGFNQWTGKRFNFTWDEGRKHIVNKSAKCMPLITRKLKKQRPWWLKLPWWSMWDAPETKGNDIDLVEGSIVGMKGNTITYETANGTKDVNADVVVLATGYRQKFPFLHAESAEDDPLPPEHFIIDPKEPRLAYIGFIRPNVGAIPPMSEIQAMWWVQKLEDKLLCHFPDYYKLQGRRLCYGVDYGYYMFALAREIGCVPSLLKWLWQNPRVAITCAFGQAHIPIFRLDGPFKSDEAVQTCSGELFKVIMMRPLVMNTVFFIEALGLGFLNALTAVMERPSWAAPLTAGIGAILCYKKADLIFRGAGKTHFN